MLPSPYLYNLVTSEYFFSAKLISKASSFSNLGQLQMKMVKLRSENPNFGGSYDSMPNTEMI